MWFFKKIHKKAKKIIAKPMSFLLKPSLAFSAFTTYLQCCFLYTKQSTLNYSNEKISIIHLDVFLKLILP